MRQTWGKGVSLVGRKEKLHVPPPLPLSCRTLGSLHRTSYRPLFPFVLICKSVSRQEKVGLGRAEVGLPVLLLFLIGPPQGLEQGLVPAGAQSICVG